MSTNSERAHIYDYAQIYLALTLYFKCNKRHWQTFSIANKTTYIVCNAHNLRLPYYTIVTIYYKYTDKKRMMLSRADYSKHFHTIPLLISRLYREPFKFSFSVETCQSHHIKSNLFRQCIFVCILYCQTNL